MELVDSSSIIFYFEKEKATSLAKKKKKATRWGLQFHFPLFISTQIPSFQSIWISAWKIKSFHMEPQFKHVGNLTRDKCFFLFWFLFLFCVEETRISEFIQDSIPWVFFLGVCNTHVPHTKYCRESFKRILKY